MATYGTRGDVQPLLALALGLESRGHGVTLAGPPEWQPWAEQLGCDYQPLGSDLRPFLSRVKASHGLRSAAAFHRHVMDEVSTQFEQLPAMITGADVVIGASLCLALPTVAESQKIPYRYLAFTPQILPSGAHPCPVFRCQNLPAWINRLGWRIDMLVQRFDLLATLNRHRRKINLAPLNTYWDHLLGDRLLMACDGELAPVPPDVRHPVVQTGYLHLNRYEDTRLPAELEAFLSSGSKPIYAGFGSMPPADAVRWNPMAIEAARAGGQRLILKAEEALAASISPAKDLFVGASFPHPAIFPRIRAIIHHGGAGTTAAAARSGVPQIIVPHILDQYYWGERIYRRGLGPAPIWRSRLTTQRLTTAMERCLADTEMVNRAQAVGQKIRTQAPIRAAASALENL